jgi:hypothetical protein
LFVWLFFLKGSNPQLLRHYKELEELRQHKQWAAHRWYQYQHENLDNMLKSELQQAEEEYRADLNALRERMLGAAAEKKKKFLEERHSMTLSGMRKLSSETAQAERERDISSL